MLEGVKTFAESAFLANTLDPYLYAIAPETKSYLHKHNLYFQIFIQ